MRQETLWKRQLFVKVCCLDQRDLATALKRGLYGRQHPDGLNQLSIAEGAFAGAKALQDGGEPTVIAIAGIQRGVTTPAWAVAECLEAVPFAQ